MSHTSNTSVPAAGQDAATGRFLPGNSGRKRGIRNRRTVFWEQLEAKGEAAVEKILDRMISQAINDGDTKAADLVLARFYPAPRHRKLPVKFPNITDAPGLGAAYAATLEAVSRGIIDPEEAAKVAAILEGQRRNLEDSDTQKRMKAIEDRMRSGDANG